MSSIPIGSTFLKNLNLAVAFVKESILNRVFLVRQFRRWQWLVAFGLSVLLSVTAIHADAATTPQQDLQRLDVHIQEALTKVRAKDIKGAKSEFGAYHEAWFDIEDGVKKISRQSYKDIESAMGEVQFALSINPPDQSQVLRSLTSLHDLNQKFITNQVQSTPDQAVTSKDTVTITSLIERLNRADTAIGQHDIPTAASEIKAFQSDWLEVEGIVATKSKQHYVTIENEMAQAYGFLSAKPADINNARQSIDILKQNLQPYAGENLRYGIFDAALILFREGMEALLVLIALLAFLNKSGNADKGRWLWLGAGAGLLASILTALIIQLFFSNLRSAGVNRELLEGGVGIVAAVMLFSVSYWLHSKSSLGAWEGYIREQATSALNRNSVLSLSLLSFLAVFREGGETVLFYIGMAPSISNSDLVTGLLLGSFVLIVIATLVLGVGLKIPLKPFFFVTSLLIYYLGFKFIGSGIHSLQVAGVLPASAEPFLPSWETFGLYPTWQTSLVQLAIILMTVAVIFHNRSRAALNVAK